MNDFDKFRYSKADCKTMGHENCKKVLVWYQQSGWHLEKIIHNVYGKTHIERH